jgi:DNA-directed RNA polymerase subunit RPC12/RpoP
MNLVGGMAIRQPTDIREVVYHTQRPLSRKSEGDQSGFCHMWVFKPACPDCGEGVLEKPKRRAEFFVCNKCGVEKPVEEVTLIAVGEYECPYCKHKDEFEQEWVRTKTSRKFKFKCANCGKYLEVQKLK